jgi:hypothetical protein
MLPGRHALGARRLDEVQRCHFEHRGARQPRVDRHEEQAQRQHRQHHVLRDVPGARNARRPPPTVSMPKGGSQSSWIENTSIAISDTQNSGVA